jgi:hypothetical protein
MQYLFDEKINAVIPDNQFRKRNSVFSDSDFYKNHKALRKKTREDQSGRDEVFHSSIFTVNLDNNSCVCPAGKEMLFQGDHLEGVRGFYSLFRGKLRDCRECVMQPQCMKKPIKDQGRQVSFLNESSKK